MKKDLLSLVLPLPIPLVPLGSLLLPLFLVPHPLTPILPLTLTLLFPLLLSLVPLPLLLLLLPLVVPLVAMAILLLRLPALPPARPPVLRMF
jgi:hypothetical protein